MNTSLEPTILTQEDLDSIAKAFDHGFKEASGQFASRNRMAAVAGIEKYREIQSRAPQLSAPAYYRTSERPPTQADADSSTCVLANCPEACSHWERKNWRLVQLNPEIWKTWKPLQDAPPAPNPETIAFETWARQHFPHFDTMAVADKDRLLGTFRDVRNISAQRREENL